MTLDAKTLLPVAFAVGSACTLQPTGANEDDFGSASATPVMGASSSAGGMDEPSPGDSSTSTDDVASTTGADPQGSGDGPDTGGAATTSGDADTDGAPLPPTASGGLPTAGPASGCYDHVDQVSCEADGCEWTPLGSGVEVCADPGVLGTGGFGDLCDSLLEANCELIGCFWDGSACSSNPEASSTTGTTETSGGATE